MTPTFTLSLGESPTEYAGQLTATEAWCGPQACALQELLGPSHLQTTSSALVLIVKEKEHAVACFPTTAPSHFLPISPSSSRVSYLPFKAHLKVSYRKTPLTLQPEQTSAFSGLSCPLFYREGSTCPALLGCL